MVKRVETIILYIMYYHIYVRLYEKSACLADMRNENARIRSRGDMRGKMYKNLNFNRERNRLLRYREAARDRADTST